MAILAAKTLHVPDEIRDPEDAALTVATEAHEQATEFVMLAESFPIATAADFEAAGEELKRIKAKEKEIETMRVSITKPLLDAKRRVDDLFKKPLDLLDKAEKAIKSGIAGYLAEIDRKRREEETARQAEAARLAREAAKAESKGHDVKAAMKHAEAAAVMQAPSVNEAPKVAGVSMSFIWRHNVIDFPALVKAVAAGKAPLDLLRPNDVEIGKRVRALGEEFRVPGIAISKDPVIRAGSR
jgi:hypothetical protein